MLTSVKGPGNVPSDLYKKVANASVVAEIAAGPSTVVGSSGVDIVCDELYTACTRREHGRAVLKRLRLSLLATVGGYTQWLPPGTGSTHIMCSAVLDQSTGTYR